jgi:hypothetical protein
MITTRSAKQGGTEEQTQVLTVQLQAHAVGVAEIQAVLHPTVRAQVVDASLAQAAPGGGELLGRDRDGQVLDPADGLGEGRVSWPGKSKKPSRLRLPMSKKKWLEPG